jgi:hypothetical protein
VLNNKSLYTPKGVAFAPTYECPARCDHCNIPFDRVDTRARLPINVALRALSDAKALGLHAYQIAGGEPTLYEDFMVEVARDGRRLSMKAHRPPTNGWLGGEPDRLHALFERLRVAGFSAGFRVSCDSFHRRVPLESTARFICIALDYFNSNHISIGCCDIDEGRSRGILARLAVIMCGIGVESKVEGDYLLTVRGRLRIGFWAPTRPTWRTVSDDAFLFREVSADEPESERFDRAAPVAPFGCLGPRGVGYFWIGPDGTVRACCGNANLFSDALLIGDAASEPLNDIHARAVRDPLLAALAEGGPVSLARDLGDTDALNARYTHRCELCALLLARTEIRRRYPRP